MKNRFKLLIAALVVVGILTTGLATTAFAEPQDEYGYAGPAYCRMQNSVNWNGSCHGFAYSGNTGYTGSQGNGTASCH